MLNRIKIGHFSDSNAATGCTVVIPPSGNCCSAFPFGASPGTRELTLLSPEKKIEEVHAIVLTGGSAFGLNCAHGVMLALKEDGFGYPTKFGLVPIVPAAVVFDKNIGNAEAFPTIENGRQAYQDARYNNTEMGNVGAGVGATVGKWAGLEYAMKGGLGIAESKQGQVDVLAITVVNAVGDVLDGQRKIMAGAIDQNHQFLAEGLKEKAFESPKVGLGENTILNITITNAKLDKTQAFYLAQRVHLSIARRIEPSHTSADGDVSFVISVPEVDAPIDVLNQLMGMAVEHSIENGIRHARPLHGFKSYNQIRGQK